MGRALRFAAVAASAAFAFAALAAPASAWTDPPRRHDPPAPAPRSAKAKAKPKPRPPEQLARAKPKPAKPRQRKTGTPWRRDGTSLVAYVRTPWVRLYSAPRAKRAKLILRKVDARGTHRAFLVRSRRAGWIQVYLPTRPNGSTAWVRKRAVRVFTNRYRLVVHVQRHMLVLWRGPRVIARFPIVVGTRATPTPRGLFYVVELLRPSNPRGAYGAYSFGLSAHSRVLRTFAGGDGRVGLHGTNQPWLLGSSVSHGCIRLSNPSVRRLAKILPLGTPVWIRR